MKQQQSKALISHVQKIQKQSAIKEVVQLMRQRSVTLVDIKPFFEDINTPLPSAIMSKVVAHRDEVQADKRMRANLEKARNARKVAKEGKSE